MRITLRQLEIFRAICSAGTVSSAAPSMGLSQAAASQGLAELENLLERKLFDRVGRRLVLNAEGRALLPAAAEILDRVREVETPAVAEMPELRLAASLTVGSYLLPEALANFCNTFSNYQLRMEISNTGQVVEGLLQFQFEAGWIEGIVRHPQLKSERWMRDELVLVCAPDYAAAGREVSLRDLQNETWLLREKGSGTREVFERAVGDRWRPLRVLEISGIEAVKRTTMAGGGLSCLSRAAVASELSMGQLAQVVVPGLNLRRDITLLIHRRKYLDRALLLFLEFMRAQRVQKSPAP